MSETVIKVDGAGKKFSRSLRQMMLYGVQDIFWTVLGKEVTDAGLRKGEFWAVHDTSFELKRGETLGLIGPNGSGKTTLLKMLNGIFMPDKGRIEVKGRVGALIEIGAGFHPMLSGRENIYVNGAILGMSKKEIDGKFNSIVDFADIGDFLDSPVKHYSSGMYVRLGFAVAVHSNPEILLIDEILAVGDYGFQLKCFNKVGELRKNKTTTVLVSHNMHIISTFAEKAVFLLNGKAEYFDNVSEGVKKYTRLFGKIEDMDLEKICSGNDKIKFSDVRINKKVFRPGEIFSISMEYESSIDYDEVDIDVAIFSNADPKAYFQATNKAYNRRIDLKKGSHRLEIKVEDIKINNAMAKIAITIWSKGRSESLFWWRIPVEFRGIEYSTGKNFLDVSYEVDG